MSLMGHHSWDNSSEFLGLVWVGLVYWGLTPQQQLARVISKRWNDDDEISFLVEEFLGLLYRSYTYYKEPIIIYYYVPVFFKQEVSARGTVSLRDHEMQVLEEQLGRTTKGWTIGYRGGGYMGFLSQLTIIFMAIPHIRGMGLKGTGLSHIRRTGLRGMGLSQRNGSQRKRSHIRGMGLRGT